MTLATSRFDLWRDSTIDGTGNFDPAVDMGAQADFFMYGEFIYQGLPSSDSGIFICNGNTSVALGILFSVSGSDVFAQPYYNNIRAADYLKLPTMTVGQTYRIAFRIPGSLATYDGKQYVTGEGVAKNPTGSVNGGFSSAALTQCEVGKGYYSTAFNGTAVKFGWGHSISDAEALDLVATGVAGVASVAPGTPASITPSAVTEDTMTLTVAVTATADGYELQHSPNGTTGWVSVARQASNIFNVTYAGVSGDDNWRALAYNAASPSDSGWTATLTAGFENTVIEGGGVLPGGSLAPNVPLAIVPSAVLAGSMTLTVTPDTSGEVIAGYELQHSDGQTWTSAARQASPVFNVTSAGVSGHTLWRALAFNLTGDSGWTTGLPSGLAVNSTTGQITGTTSFVGNTKAGLIASNGTAPNAVQILDLTFS